MKLYDVAIIGGGPAGLSAALVLARARRSTIVFDAGTPRNSYSPGVYGFPSRDGILPAKLKGLVRAELASYGGVDVVASTVTKFESYKRHSYVIEDASGRLTRARSIILAMGMTDVFPAWQGFASLWGKSILHCAHCHGWEVRGRQWGVVANSVAAAAAAYQYRSWTENVTIFADPGLDIPAATLSRLGSADISVERCRIRDLVLSEEGTLSGVRTSNDNVLPCEVLICSPPQRVPGLVRTMRIRASRCGRVAVNGRNETSLPRVFAAGDITPGPQNALAAAAEGAAVAKAIIPDLALGMSTAHRLFETASASEHDLGALA